MNMKRNGKKNSKTSAQRWVKTYAAVYWTDLHEWVHSADHDLRIGGAMNS